MQKDTATDNPLAYRIKDLCLLMGISPSTLWKLAKQDKIRLIRVGGRTLVPASEVARLLSGEVAR